MNSRDELLTAYKELEDGTFIKQNAMYENKE